MLTRWRFLLAVVLAAATFRVPNFARAEYILDDFDDGAEVSSPEMEAVAMYTDDVGQLHAARGIYIYGNQSDPSAQLDSNVTAPSTLTGMFNAFQPGDPVGALVGFVTGYTFDRPFDFTESSTNNALLFDFRSISGPKPPALLYATIDGSAGHLRAELPSFGSPRTIAMPFSSLGSRSGISPLLVFQAVNSVKFTLSIDNTGAQFEGGVFHLERIRVGRIVPEPNTNALIGMFAFIVATRRIRADCEMLYSSYTA